MFGLWVLLNDAFNFIMTIWRRKIVYTKSSEYFFPSWYSSNFSNEFCGGNLDHGKTLSASPEFFLRFYPSAIMVVTQISTEDTR